MFPREGEVISVDITSEHRIRAEEVLMTLPVYRGSHRGGAANQVGVLGEVVARETLELLGISMTPIFKTTHDFELRTGRRVEVKTKDRTVPPRPDYECSIPQYNHDHQDVDYYVFVSLERSRDRNDDALDRFVKAHIVGAANRRLMAVKGVNRATGETDPRNGTTFWTACRNIYIRDLVDLETAVSHWKRAGA